MKKCNRDCFNCVFDDCIQESVSKDERFMQDYRDKVATVTGRIHRGCRSVKRKGGRYESGMPFKIKQQAEYKE